MSAMKWLIDRSTESYRPVSLLALQIQKGFEESASGTWIDS